MPINVIDTVKVKYNFDGDNNTELTIRKDDIIDVIVIDPSGWADGIIRSKKKKRMVSYAVYKIHSRPGKYEITSRKK